MGLVIRACDKNGGRFANDLAMGTVIRIRDENAGRFANDFALGTVIVILWRMLAALQMTSGYGGMIASMTTMTKQSLGTL